MTREIPLTKGKVAIVDDADYEWLSRWKWCYIRTSEGCEYVMRKIRRDGRQMTILMHRLIVNPQPGYEVDHIDHNGLNNTRGNLRQCTHQENMRNKRRRADASAPYKGVWYQKRGGGWGANITIDGKRTHLGTYETVEKAALAYDEAARLHFGEFAKLNFPDRNETPFSDRNARVAIKRARVGGERQQTEENRHIRKEMHRRLLAGESPHVIAQSLGIKIMRVHKANSRLRRKTERVT